MLFIHILLTVVLIIDNFTTTPCALGEERLLISKSEEPSKGFIIYCPCMGRFGNQAEQLLGSISFAKSLNRTLVLPPFIQYGLDHNPILVPFEDILNVDSIKEYHNVILLTDFMNQHAKHIWPPGQRQFFCYSKRKSNLDDNFSSCDALEGQPFQTFWTSFNVTEDKTVFYSPLTTNPTNANEWQELYPASKYRILTFVGAPSPFPTHEDSIQIQKYVAFSDKVKRMASNERKLRNFTDRPYLSMHMRHGSDWKKACELTKSIENLTQMFSSAQCTGYQSGKLLKYEYCLPTFESIVAKLGVSLEWYQRKHGKAIEVIHLATDYSDTSVQKKLKNRFPGIEFVTNEKHSGTMIGIMIDLYWMTYADVFIGNCMSSFSAFPARIRVERYNLRDTTQYFGYDFKELRHNKVNEEL